MNFTYNFDTYTLESEDPNVYVKVAGKSPDQGTFFALYMGEKKIGFASNYHWRSEQSEVREDGSVIWRITEIGCALYQRQAYIGGGMDEDIPPYRFDDEAEQQQVMDVILDAVRAYPGIPDTSCDGEEPKFVETGVQPDVEFTEGALLKAEKGVLMRGATPFKYNREINAIQHNEEPDIFVRYVPGFRDEGAGFVLYFRGKEIGFLTAYYGGDVRTQKLTDGTKVWRIGEVGAWVRDNPGGGVVAPVPSY